MVEPRWTQKWQRDERDGVMSGLSISDRHSPNAAHRLPQDGDAIADDQLLLRVRGEYTEMPGLHLTVAEASRLWQVDRRVCEALLTRLVEEQFLMRTPKGEFTQRREA
jgi:hypothetical protein